MNRLFSALGIICTATYVLALWWLFGGRLSEIYAMPPNNVGDFLAGIFGPLAILWLILGFFQQGVELRQNTRALELQAEELRNSVDQQRSLVEVSRKQMEAELETIRFEREQQAKAARPMFVFHGVGSMFTGMKGTYQSRVKNLGNTATDVVFLYEPPIESSSLTKIYSWARGEERQLEWQYLTPLAEESVTLSITYVDAAGVPGTQVFRFDPIERGVHKSVEIVPVVAAEQTND